MPETNRFAELAAVDVSKYVEKKQNLSYLSWAWAVDQLLRRDPEASWTYPDEKHYGETVMVFCEVTAFGKTKRAHLPVMDHRNRPIPNPDAFAVNTAMQRCLVKAIALHGLGLYIYAGEDVPRAEDEGKAAADGVIDRIKGATVTARDSMGEVYRAYPAEEREEIDRIADEATALIKGGDVAGAAAMLNEFCGTDNESRLAVSYRLAEAGVLNKLKAHKQKSELASQA